MPKPASVHFFPICSYILKKKKSDTITNNRKIAVVFKRMKCLPLWYQ